MKNRSGGIFLICHFSLVLVFVTATAIRTIAFKTSFEQSVSIPNTPAGVKLAQWLEAFNSGNEERIRQFISQQFSKNALEKSPAGLRTLFQKSRFYETRGYAVHKVEESMPAQIIVLAQGKLTGLWYRLKLLTTDEEPFAIIEYSAIRISHPSSIGSSGKMSPGEVVTQLKMFLAKLVKEDIFSGTVLVAKDGNALFKSAYGQASKTYNYPNNINTKFNLASVNKMFTAVAIAQLAENGKLTFTDTISKHLSDYPNSEVAKKVTIHHLLTHTSGMGDIYNEKFYMQRDQFRNVRDYFPLFADKPLSFEPGLGEQYSNAGYIVLGSIIEKAAGQNYFKYLQGHIFTPTGMINTGFYELDEIVPNIATGYTNKTPEGGANLRRRRQLLYNEGVKGNPAGHGYSTVEDLLRFCNALLQHKLLSPKYLNLLTTVHSFREDPEDMYGYGFQIADINRSKIIGHTGGGYGGMAIVDIYLDTGYTVIVLSNYQRGGNLVAYKLRDIITQK